VSVVRMTNRRRGIRVPRFLGPCVATTSPQPILDRFSRFGTAHAREQQTRADRDNGSNRLHLMLRIAMRRKSNENEALVEKRRHASQTFLSRTNASRA